MTHKERFNTQLVQRERYKQIYFPWLDKEKPVGNGSKIMDKPEAKESKTFTEKVFRMTLD